MVFFLKKSFDGKFYVTFINIYIRSYQENTKLLIASIFKKQELIEVKKKNYYEYFREFLEKYDIMSLSVTAVIATG